MKNKKVTYFLLAGALVVWGSVFFRVFSRKAVPEVALPTQLPPVEKTDTVYRMMLNYRDPFLDHAAAIPVPDSLPVVIAKMPDPAPDRTVMRYMGKLRKNKIAYYLIEVDGVEYLLSPGQTVEDIHLGKEFADSLIILKDTRKYTLQID